MNRNLQDYDIVMFLPSPFFFPFIPVIFIIYVHIIELGCNF